MDFDSPDIDACMASYMPLSNLPTPPSTSDHAISLFECYNGSASSMFDAYTLRTASPSKNLAAYLVHSLPSNLANYNPCADTVASYLDRANLPDSILGLAICILETLSHRFVRSWRQSSFYAALSHSKAEVVVVGALAVASAFLDDLRREAHWWSNSITWGNITARQINVTIRCILADIEYNLHVFTPEMIADAVQEGRGDVATVLEKTESVADPQLSIHESNKNTKRDSGWHGETIWQHGLVTPEPSPIEEPMRFLRLL